MREVGGVPAHLRKLRQLEPIRPLLEPLAVRLGRRRGRGGGRPSEQRVEAAAQVERERAETAA